jgi:hypothetical protein
VRVRIYRRMHAESYQGATRFVLAALTALALSACGGSAVEAPRPASASTVATIEPSGGTLQFPLADGYGGSFVYSANDARVATSAQLTTTTATVPNRPGPPPPGTILVSFEFHLTNSVRFSKWNSLLTTISLPSTVPTAGNTFAEYGYDLTAQTQLGWNPGVISGTTIAFPTGLLPVTLTTHRYLYTLVTQ